MKDYFQKGFSRFLSYFGSEKNKGRFFEYYLGLLSLILFFILKLNYISLDIKLKK